MESLTHRLINMVDQVMVNQMTELVEQTKLQSQCPMDCKKKETWLFCNNREVIFKKAANRLSKSCENERKKTVASLSSIWGFSKPLRNKPEKDLEVCGDSSDSNNKSSSKRRFVTAAKTAVLIKAVKQGRDICTCATLDTDCKLHDT